MALVGFLSSNRLPLPASQLIQDRRSTAPVRVFASMGEQRRNLLPPALGRGSLQLACLGNGLTGDAQLQGEKPGMERRLCPGCSGLGRTRLEAMRMRQEGIQGRAEG